MKTFTLIFFTGAFLFAQTATFQPVATVDELMDRIIIPTSDAIFGVGGETPKDDTEWTTLENNALMLAESGNLLLMHNPSTDNSVWIKESRALVTAGAAAFSAAKVRNIEGILEAGDKIYETCAGCHDQYLKEK